MLVFYLAQQNQAVGGRHPVIWEDLVKSGIIGKTAIPCPALPICCQFLEGSRRPPHILLQGARVAAPHPESVEQ
ncbi:MAG: hypothetical protein DSY42_09285 [Aquifex sp.]|nr:MAG: hypothetical protein DSY42_09285 [Aquifex sp.]